MMKQLLQTLFRKKSLEEKLAEICNAKKCLSTFKKLGISPTTAEKKDLSKIAWDLYPQFIRSRSSYTASYEPFLRDGYRLGTIDETLNTNFLNAFASAKAIPFDCEDSDPNYSSIRLGVEAEEKLNKSHTYVMWEDLQLEALKPILAALKEPVSQCLGSPWRVATIRAWKTGAQSEIFGPSDWHLDGLPTASFKVMFYPLGASKEKGSVELQLPQGNLLVEGGPGTWMLFKNSEVLHRGVAPQKGERIAVEITLLPSLTWDLTPISAGHNARHPALPWHQPYSSQHPLYKRGEVVGVNIGGGPHWNCPDWINLEEFATPSFHLFPNCRFPFENASVQNVYTSHAIEHLNTPTVYRILSESHRILEKEGNLIIKIPDFDKALDAWRNQDPSFFSSEWNLESVIPSWQTKQVPDDLDHRAAMIFCSYYNDGYGNPFAPSQRKSKSAYFGPAPLSTPALQELIKDRTPSQITQALRKAINLAEKNPHFVHQNAWSREELQNLLISFGFTIVSFDPKLITEQFKTIPGITEMENISTFCWAKKIG